jgi:hypothetical protein
MITAYPKVHTLGHREIRDLLNGPVTVEEKVDGSQFSFGVRNGVLVCRSKGQELNMASPEKMFARAIAACQALQNSLVDGWNYRGEYLDKPKHNALSYERVPLNHIAIFDIQNRSGEYIQREAMELIVRDLGFEAVPLLATGMVNSAERLKGLFETTSFLGGAKIEGVVVKRRTGNLALGKFVSDAFKEVHQKNWKSKPLRPGVVGQLITAYQCKGRWQKAVQHLAERGKLDESPVDIGALIKEVHADIKLECEDEIKQLLWDGFSKEILSGSTTGLAQWYKAKLAGLDSDV